MIHTDGAQTIANAPRPKRKTSCEDIERALLAEIARLRRALERQL